MSEQLPAVFLSGAVVTPDETHIVPSLIANQGDAAGWRYIEFFTANINNAHTRRAYARACGCFFVWCEQHYDPTLRRGGLGECAAGETRGCGCEAAARCGAGRSTR